MVLICKGSAWAESKKLFVEDELLIQFRIDTPNDKADEALNAHGAKVADEIQQLRIKRIKVPANVLDTVREALSHNPHVEFVENNLLAEASVIPNDSYYASQWHHPKIKSPYGWDLNTGSNTIAIAIIDSGVDPAHSDLASKLVPGYNFVSNNTDTHDVLGHGTSVAGSSAAISNNYTGIAGVAWQNPIMPLMVIGADNLASYYDISEAIIYAADRGVRVMNISLAGPGISSTLQNAADYAWNKGALIFAGAGNSSTSTPYYPAACNHVIGVSATDSNDNKASFSNYGDWVDIAAPGVSIYTTANGGGYRSASGTSFSSPIAAGLGALIMSVNPDLTNAEVEELIKQNADDLGALGFDPYFGFGRINVERTVVAASSIVIDDADTTPPSAYITSPANNVAVSGIITVSVSVMDNVGVSKVELYINGALFASDSSSPFSFTWDTTKLTDGSYSLKVLAYDSAGNVGQSASVTVTVSNADTTAPTASITSPANSATVSGIITVSASASDNVGVSKVELYINGTLFASDSSSPFTFTWDTTKYANSTYTLKAIAYDGSGNVGQSATVTVTVLNQQDTIAPQVVITAPADGSSVSASPVVKIAISASDNAGVSTIELYIDGKLTAATNASSLAYNWNIKKVSAGAHTISAKAFDAAGNAGVRTITVYK